MNQNKRRLSRRQVGRLFAGTAAAISLPLGHSIADAHSDYVEQTLGNPDSDVLVIEYASFVCGHCRHFHEKIFPKLKADYIDTGRIEFRLRDIYVNRYAVWAAMVARCGGPDRYFGLVDQVFKQQSRWAYNQDPKKTVDHLRSIGLAGGLTQDQIDQCLTDRQAADTLVEASNRFSRQHGINSTPTFVINGRIHQNMPQEEFFAVIDDALGS